MLAKELISLLGTVGDDTPVVLAKDAEGNGFSPLDEGTTEFYLPDSTYSGELVAGRTEGRGVERGAVADELNAAPQVGDVVKVRGDTRFWRVEKLRPNLYCDICLITLCEPRVRMEVNTKWVSLAS